MSLLRKPLATSGLVHDISPEDAGWTYVGFKLYRLSPGESVSGSLGSNEAILVMVEGKAAIRAADTDWGVLGERMDVFEKTPPHCLYVPNGKDWAAVAETPCTLAVCLAPGQSGHEARRLGPDGITLTQSALTAHIGSFGGTFVAIAIFFFAFTSIIGNLSYAENAMTFLGAGGKIGMTFIRLFALAMVLWGSLQSVATVFNTADASMGLMATINLIAILALSGTVVKLTKDYFAQKRTGLEPTFDNDLYPELKGKIDSTIWTMNGDIGPRR